MKRFKLQKVTKSVIATALALVITIGALPIGHVFATGSGKNNPDIQKIENIALDYSKYFDSSVVFKLPDTINADDEISVIITTDDNAVIDVYEGSDKTMSLSDFALKSNYAKAAKQKLAKSKAEVLAELDKKNISYKIGEEYSTILNGFELVIKASDFENTCKSLGKGMDIIVGEEYNTCETQLVENAVDVFDTGIFDSSDSGYDGSGMVVAVLDTGIDSNHTAFSTDNFTSKKIGLTYDDVKAVIKDTVAAEQLDGLTVDDVYINEKIPYNFDYADVDSDAYSTHNNHGTHVSGVIVGNDDTIRGVAPNAQLVSMKIFSDVMDTARTAWILAALEDCIILGVDVINMSIGTACGFSRESDEEAVDGIYDKLRDSGICMVVAASNSYNSAYGSEKNGNLGLTSNPDTGTVGSPSTYDGVMSVASIAGAETPYIEYDGKIIYFVETTNGAAEENNFYDALLGDKKSKKFEYVVIPGVGRSADYTGIDVKGKIALVRRGSNTFEEKAMIAQEQEAAGIIIYNNVSGDIKMNVGDATLAVCSISQDDGEMLAEKGSGTLKISRKQTSGPFISDFSSWGPTPDLKIKPEITAHGGSILSSITGGSYDRLSGTSMACPNYAGVVVLLRQYVVENYPEIADDNQAVNTMVNCLLMSTADIALGKNGLPYSVRKQGAGLANLTNSINSPAYITVTDKDGNVTDKAKLELGDDAKKTGEYQMTFTINNTGKRAVSYKLGAYVMTEGVSDTKTAAGETTVTEESYLLDGAEFEIVSVEGGKKSGDKVRVGKGKEATVTVKVTLSDEDKEYLDNSFENGMYVEGFITLDAKSGTKVDLNVPYLAFYGDWTKAPLFDLTYYDTNADELDDGIDEEDKVKADAYATRPVGGVSDDYVSYLGSYYFLQDPDDMVISANENYVALSNQVGTIHSLRFVWAGLLRNAAKIDITITDDTTGDVIFERTETDVRKSYSDGGASIYPSNVKIEFDTTEYNLENNSDYTVRLVGYLDYGEGGLQTNENNVFEFPLVADFEAPTVTDVEYRYEYDKTLKKNKLYADVYIYDNHYAMCSQIGYVTEEADADGNVGPAMKTLEQYMTPVYSERNSTTKVTYELTDYIYKIKNNATTKNTFVINAYDYALNYATYELALPDDFTDFYFEGLEDGLTLSPNEVYTLEPIVTPDTEWAELLEYSSSKQSVVRVVNNKLIAIKSGTAIIKAQDPLNNKSYTFNVTVLEKGDDGYRRYDKPVADVFTLDGFNTQKAYYILENEDKKLGDTGSTNFFEGKYKLEMYPSETVALNLSLDSYFKNDTTISFESSNEAIVKVDESGVVTAQAEGFASITVKVLLDDKSTYYSETVNVEVKDPYVTTGAMLTHYYGNGGLVDIPEDLSLTQIGQFAFSNFEYILKTEEELAFDDAETSKAWFIGDNTITKVVIPEGVESIANYAFANLTALEEVVLPSTLESIDYGAFYGCTALQKITFSGDNNLKIINQNAFENCDLRDIDLPSACVISDYAFAGNQKLKSIKLGENLYSVGQYAFAGCKKLKDVTIDAKKVKYGAYAFTGCESLEEFYVNSAVLPEGMFYECDDLEKVIIGTDVNDIGVFAFRDTKVSEFELEKGNNNYKIYEKEYILSKDGKKLIAVSPVIEGEFTYNNLGNDKPIEISKGAFSHNQKITSVVMEKVTTVGEYSLASNKSLSSVTFGELKNIGDYAFFEASITEMPVLDKKVSIGKYAFSFTKLTSVTIPDKTEIPEGAFSECTDLATVVIGDDVNIGKYAFSMDKDQAFKVEMYMEGEQKLFRYVFSSSLTSLTIGKNAVIGENAFSNAASLESVTLGEGAELGKMAFYNTSSLKFIDLSKAKEIGDYAVSGDVYYACLDENMSVAAVNSEGMYRYTYHGPKIESVDISSTKSLGEYAFSYCRDLVSVNLSDNITEIKPYTFAGCDALKQINLDNVETIGEYAFMECGLESVDASKSEKIEKYAFVSNRLLTSLKLCEKTKEIGEGAFSYCDPLVTVENLNCVENIGDYAFAYTAITSADLTAAVKIGRNVFIKETLTPFTVVLGDDIEKIADNPFAMCKVEPFSSVETQKVNGKEKQVTIYDYEISDTVFVIDGSLYCMNEKGMELITYAGIDNENVIVADDTVRITAYAFAGSDAVRVKLPFNTTAIGHKAFYDCNSLQMVTFGSYNVPNFEEEFDPAYYGSFENIPGTGDFGTYTDYDGNEVQINGLGIVPFFMWNATGEMYSNVFYGATFVDYVGKVEDKLTMVRPVNGVGYDSFICNQYFDMTIDGPAAPDETAVDAINAIKAIPKKVTYDDKGLVEAARSAYSKVATLAQQALVINYADLVSAEQRIKALDPNAQNTDDSINEDSKSNVGIWILIIVIALAVITAAILIIKKFKEQISKFTKPIFDKVSKVFKPIIDKVSALLKPVWNKIVDFCKPIFEKISAFTKPIFEKIAKFLKPIITKIGSSIKIAALWVAKLATRVFNVCKAFIINLYNIVAPRIVEWIKDFAEWISIFVPLVWTKIVKFFYGIVIKLSDRNKKNEQITETEEEAQENEEN
ncbi:MAG: leucine-rich repeat protein [Clostridia bacterium]|nr:leucine-rich repeat protein [Clostridia bacterium]